MKLGRFMLVPAFALVGLFLMSSTANAGGDGKAVFQANKCTNCHTVKSQGVAKTGTEEEKITDLSTVGKERNADWIKGYLMKQNDIKGKKHKKAWKGTDADLATLVGWLAGLK